MNLEQFRIQHSTLIEHYQFIEAHLEGIYAALSGKSLLDGLADVENDNMNRILNEIKKIEDQNNISVLTKDDLISLREVIARRNFWCHNCYYDLVFDKKTGGLKKFKDIQIMNNDLMEAEKWRQKLYDLQMRLFEQNHNSLCSY